jgi:hypothetical protein
MSLLSLSSQYAEQLFSYFESMSAKWGKDLLSNGRCFETTEQMIFGTFVCKYTPMNIKSSWLDDA